MMEPMLMAVLAVRSLRKLELVGDHRQLPAFVQNCWFNLETTHPSIKVSLFERLVTGGTLRNRFSGADPQRGADDTVSCASHQRHRDTCDHAPKLRREGTQHRVARTPQNLDAPSGSPFHRVHSFYLLVLLVVILLIFKSSNISNIY